LVPIVKRRIRFFVATAFRTLHSDHTGIRFAFDCFPLRLTAAFWAGMWAVKSWIVLEERLRFFHSVGSSCEHYRSVVFQPKSGDCGDPAARGALGLVGAEGLSDGLRAAGVVFVRSRVKVGEPENSPCPSITMPVTL
jgi:hypothetical protein